MERTKVLLVGVGGFGAGYVRELLEGAAGQRAQVVGVVDPYAKQSPAYPLLERAGTPIHETVEAFYAQGEAELAVIATPIQFHEHQACFCLRAGSHVLLEKPMAATVEQAKAILAARDASGRKLAVGFQWCYDRTMLRLKADVAAGLYGAPLDLKAMALWPRDRAYYRRGLGWAGKRLDASGAPIYDNVVSNATAHYLFNMLWLPGADFRGQGLESLRALCYRANEIETFDTVVMEGRNEAGARLWYAASHAAGRDYNQNPVFEYRFEEACLRFGALGETGERLTAWKGDRLVKDYGPSSLNDLTKLGVVLDHVAGRGPLPCPGEAALKHVEAMEALRLACPEAPFFPPERVEEADGFKRVEGLGAKLVELYRQEAFPEAL